MNAYTQPYRYRLQVTLAGVFALGALSTAVIYEVRSTPFTMVLFLMGGAGLLFVAAVLFAWTVWRDVRTRMQSLTSRKFAPGEFIFKQGEPAEHVYVITKGKVEAVFSHPQKGEVVLAQLGPQEYFGETAILSQLPRQASARAVDAVELLAIHRTDFLRLYGTLPRLRERIEAEQSERKALLARQLEK